MTEPHWLSPEQLAAWTRLVAVVELLPGALDTQLQHDADLTHFEYFTLAMLSEAEGRSLRMTALASRTNATLPRLSHVVSRLERRNYVRRVPDVDDRRAINAQLTDEGWRKVLDTAPGHVDTVRQSVIDALDERDIDDMRRIMAKVLDRLDPDRRFGMTTGPM
ncbi:MarR family winged helix-turn-helix transcriptional regulator [Paramicrobacterium chengjingii]|uniref:MarR family transcriptional regulator n=1 Tax=Paramicrobacterium chengjingii TaxID=2769067 RepID=A0ABX6YIC0_9MICO|nr:MarR family transcriptional regulator [Microbacterium chengjingii]QPZ38517.1 MarR family transcriptional regulator [Microbacterium chengjingii]